MAIRTYSDISGSLLDVIPNAEEMKALSFEEIQQLRLFGNSLDNALYIELQRRLADEERKAI